MLCSACESRYGAHTAHAQTHVMLLIEPRHLGHLIALERELWCELGDKIDRSDRVEVIVIAV